jgi:hypothetical protein
MATPTYDPGRNVLTVYDQNVTGFAEGTFIEVERAEDTYSTHVGGQGEVTRVRSRNQTGTVKITLAGSSPMNRVLSDKMREDELGGTSVTQLQLKDLNGDTVCDAPEAWLIRPASVSVGTDLEDREWTFACAKLNMQVGGNV